MDVFRFAKIPMRANDPTRRYRIVQGEDETIGRLEIGGDAPDGDSVVLTVDCRAVLAGAERESGARALTASNMAVARRRRHLIVDT